jgi:hypothetical protein
MFIVTELTIENVSDESIEAQDLAYADLLDNEEMSVGVHWHYGFDGEIESGESIDAELVFNVFESSYYELVFGYSEISVSNEVRCKFDAEDIQ